MKKTALISAGLVTAGMFLRSYYETHYCITTEYMMKSNKVPKAFDGYRIAVLADLHENQLGKDNMRLFRKIKMYQPDLILCPGDMLFCRQGQFQYEVGLNLLSKLACRYPVYCTAGNHELRVEKCGRREAYEKELHLAGVRILDDTSIEIQRQNQTIVLAGLRLERRFYPGMHSQEFFDMEIDYIEKTLGRKQKDFTILLAHSPHYFQYYAEWGADLVVSGHCHGGVIRLPFVGGLLSNGSTEGFRYDKGMYECHGKYGKSVMVLSGGLGMHTVNFRLNNPAELVGITLKREG